MFFLCGEVGLDTDSRGRDFFAGRWGSTRTHADGVTLEPAGFTYGFTIKLPAELLNLASDDDTRNILGVVKRYGLRFKPVHGPVLPGSGQKSTIMVSTGYLKSGR